MLGLDIGLLYRRAIMYSKNGRKWIEKKIKRTLKVFAREGVHFYDERSFDKRRSTTKQRSVPFAMQRAV